jgi:hypothetical protein
MPNIFQLNLTPLINLTSLIEERLGYAPTRRIASCNGLL